MDNPDRPIDKELVCIGVEHIDEKRIHAVNLIEELGEQPTETISDEHFLTAFAKLQVVMAEFFAREEEVIRLIGLPESEIRQHFMEHDKLLDFFNTIYLDSMEHKTSLAREVWSSLKAAAEKHFKEYDARLHDILSARHGLSGSELVQLTGITPKK